MYLNMSSVKSQPFWSVLIVLTHWGRVTHICVGNLTIIGSYNGLSPGWRQAIIWTNTGILSIVPLGTNFTEILIEILFFDSRKCVWKCRLRNGVPFVLASMCSLCPRDTIWRYRTCPALVQVMACCLTAPRHYLNQCWLITNKVSWYCGRIVVLFGRRYVLIVYIDGLVQDCSISIANTMEILQSRTKPSIYGSGHEGEAV